MIVVALIIALPVCDSLRRRPRRSVAEKWVGAGVLNAECGECPTACLAFQEFVVLLFSWGLFICSLLQEAVQPTLDPSAETLCANPGEEGN